MAEKKKTSESIVDLEEGSKGKNTEKEKYKPSWVKIKPDEMEKIIIDLAKQGESPSKIGMILRDRHGIPKTKILGKKITSILINSGTMHKTEKMFHEERIQKLKNHIGKNKKDYNASRSLTKKLWVMYKLEGTN